jgi:curli biogenesis system outer membrane secretion channel CsgG
MIRILTRNSTYLILLAIVAAVAFALTTSSCSHSKKAPQITLSELKNKKVALAEVRGAKEARTQVEVAIVNEIIEQGRFQIIDRATVANALVEHPTEGDWQRLGQALGADIIFSVDVVEFKTDQRTGYDAIEEEDSLLSEEHRESRKKKWRKLYKVRQREGYVKLNMRFFDVAQGRVISEGPAEASASHNSRDGDTPRAMKLLETLTSKAVRSYFDGLPE